MMTGSEAESDQKRVHGRVLVQNVRANSGTLIDASAGGLRIKGKAPGGTKPGTIMNITVAAEGESVELPCEVRWIQRHPFRGATFGVSFVEIDDELRRELFTIIRRAGTETRCRWSAA